MPSSPDRMIPARRGAVVSALAETAPLTPSGPSHDHDAVDRLDGFRVGRDEGFQVGYEQGCDAAQQSVAGLLDGLRDAVRQAENAGEVAEERVAALAIALAVELAERIVGGDLSLRETGEDVIVRAFGLRRANEDVRIRLHPDHRAWELPQRPGLELIADAQLGINDARAEIGEGLADLSIDAALERVRGALT